MLGFWYFDGFALFSQVGSDEPLYEIRSRYAFLLRGLIKCSHCVCILGDEVVFSPVVSPGCAVAGPP